MLSVGRMRIPTLPHAVLASALLAIAALAGCVHATPVAAAPLPPDELEKLRASLVGTCTVTATQKEGGEKKTAEGLTFTFEADGKAGYTARALGTSVSTKYGYRLDGRNVLMDGPYKAFRVDEYGEKELRFFVYDLSETYYCTR